MRFKIGDRVRTLVPVGHLGTDSIGYEGTVLAVRDWSDDILVEFDEDIKGHDGNFKTRGKEGHCWYCLQGNIELIERKEEKKMELMKTVLDHDMKCCSCGETIEAGKTVYMVDGDCYDEDCFNDVFFTCDGCGKLGYRDDAFYYDDCLYCDECRDEHFVECYDCGELVPVDDAYSIASCYGDGNEYICPSCREDNWTRCEDCDELFRDDDVFEGDNGYYYCSNCIDDHRGGDVICDYHEGPTLKYYRLENGRRVSSYDAEGFKGYGFELEVDDGGQDDDNAQTVIDMLDNEVYCMKDGSIDDGFEIITHPHTREALESMPMNDVLDWLVRKGYRSHDAGTCGLHLHASKALFGDSEKTRILNITKIVLFYQEFFDDILKISRRTHSQAEDWAKRYCKDKQEIREMVDKMVKGDRRRESRYYAVNLCNYATVEFRLMRGTLNKKTFWATLDFLMTCVENTKKIKLADIGKAELWLKGMKPETLEYIKSRGAFASVLGNNEIINNEGDE